MEYNRTEKLSKPALTVIENYNRFHFGNAYCPIPYFNNKVARSRAALRVRIGKGSIDEIADEVQAIVLRSRITSNLLGDEGLKKILVDNNIGIDCSGYAYHVLNAESLGRGMGPLKKRLTFVNCRSIFGQFYCRLRAESNADVLTFAAPENSRPVPLGEAKPGDIITMLSENESELAARNHILIIEMIESNQTSIEPYAIRLHYSHAVAYPEDGKYGSRPRNGEIAVIHPNEPLTSQIWTEEGYDNEKNPIFRKAQKSRTELRRLNWF